MKAIVAHHDLSGPAHALANIRAARIDDASTKTLGVLVGRLFGSCVVTVGSTLFLEDMVGLGNVLRALDLLHFLGLVALETVN